MKFTFNVDDIQEEVLRCGVKDVEIEVDYGFDFGNNDEYKKKCEELMVKCENIIENREIKLKERILTISNLF